MVKLTPIDGEGPEINLEEMDPDAPRVSQPFLDRIAMGRRLGKLAVHLGKGALEGAEEAWGETKLGFNEGSEATKFLRDNKIFQSEEDIAAGRVAPLRLASEAIARPAAAVLDGVGRLFKAGAGAAGGLAGALAEEAGASQGEANRLRRDVEGLADIAMLMLGDPARSGAFRLRRTPSGSIVEEPVGGLPREGDFHAAAQAALEAPEPGPHVADKLKRAYDERGIHPAEAAADAAGDPLLRQDLADRGPQLPAAYGGDKAPKAAEGGGGGKPLKPAEGPPGEPPRIEGPKAEPGAAMPLEEAQAAIERHLSIGEEAKGRAFTWDRFYESMVTRLWPVDKKVIESGRSYAVADNPAALAQMFAGWSQKADQFLTNKAFNLFEGKTVGEGLEEILAPVKGELREFRIFAAAARSRELELRGIDTGFDPRAVMAVGQHRTIQFEVTLVKLVGFQNNVAAYLRDSGVLSREGYKAMGEANRLFLPLHVLHEGEGLGLAQVGGSLQATNPVHKIKGADYRRIDPLESIIKNTYLYIAMAEKNVVADKLVRTLNDLEVTELKSANRSLVKVAEAEGGELSPTVIKNLTDAGLGGGHINAAEDLGAFIQETARPLGKDQIAVFRNGRREVWRVGDDIARSIKNLDAQSVGMLEKMLAPFTRSLRAGAVVNPDFQLRHTWRDFFYAFVTYKDPTGAPAIFTPLDTWAGIKGLVKGNRDTDFVDFMRNGGGNTSMVSLDRRYLQESLDKLTQEGGLMWRTWNVVTTPESSMAEKFSAVAGVPLEAAKQGYHYLQLGTELAVTANKLGAYKKAMRSMERQRGPAPLAPEFAGLEGPEASVQITQKPQRSGNLPAALSGDLVIRDGVSVRDALRGFRDSITDGDFIDMAVADTPEKRMKLEAVWTARNTGVDAARIGSQTRAYNMISAFANIKIQDTDRIVRALMERPGATSLAIGAGITAPSVLLWLHNKDDSRYQALPDWQKNLFWVLPTDSWEPASVDHAMTRPADQVRIIDGQIHVNNGVLWRFPKPFLMGVVFGSGPERLLDAYVGKEGGASGWLHAAKEASIGDVLPNFAIPVIEQARNKATMTGHRVIPGNLEGGLPEYEYSNYTSQLARKLGAVVSAIPGMREQALHGGYTGGAAHALTSPILIENYVRAWTGTLGEYAFRALDLAGRKSGALPDPEKPTAQWSDIPVIKAFAVRHPTASTQALNDFYDLHERNAAYLKSFQAKAKEGDAAALQHILDTGGEQIMARADGYKQALGNMTQVVNRVWNDASIKPYEKRQLIDGIYYQMLGIAESGRDMLRDLAKRQEPEK